MSSSRSEAPKSRGAPRQGAPRPLPPADHAQRYQRRSTSTMMHTMRHSWLKVAAVSVTVLIGTACKDLSVANPNEPDRDRALNDALAVESLIAGSFKTWWDMQQG